MGIPELYWNVVAVKAQEEEVMDSQA